MRVLMLLPIALTINWATSLYGQGEALKLGQIPPLVTFDGKKEGGLVAGGEWSSSTLMGKVHTVFYVDPDEKKVNAHVEEALKKEKFPLDNYQSVAIVNMRATWMPKFIISGLLKKKQERFTQTVFIKDRGKKLVKEWSLPDNSYNVLLFDKQGRLLYSKATKFTDTDIAELIVLVRNNL
ncbi:MAG: transcriptional regulator [Pseudomonadota bacterium]|nr:transcriptional regulator [Pseudomonadota bacterium]